VKPTLEAVAVGAGFADGAGGRISALEEVNACFWPGQLSVIVGASGSGKSTLLQVLAGIVAPERGRVICGTLDVGALDGTRRDAWRLANCGIVFQDFRLIGELDALANTLLPAHFMHLRAPAALHRRAQSLLADLGLAGRLGPVARLSRGEQQRVALARALLLDPPMLLADEATASLDAENGQRVADALRAAANAGKTVIAVTHDDKLSTLADQRLTLKAGRVVEPRRFRS
jgi:putative ABC transport system ATP-binding protein